VKRYGGDHYVSLDAPLYTLLQILSVTLFEKMAIHQAVTGAEYKPSNDEQYNQFESICGLTGH
jgi:hypothetical protein